MLWRSFLDPSIHPTISNHLQQSISIPIPIQQNQYHTSMKTPFLSPDLVVAAVTRRLLNSPLRNVEFTLHQGYFVVGECGRGMHINVNEHHHRVNRVQTEHYRINRMHLTLNHPNPGSYPAAVECRRRLRDFGMRYNDIDVYLQASHPLSNRPARYTIKNWEEYHVLPQVDLPINVNLLNHLDMTTYLNGGDINATQVGFTVNVNEIKRTSRILRWENKRPEFLNFLSTKVLEIPRFHQLQLPASAFIRLLYKAQQLGLPYKLPSEKDLRTTLHMRAFAAENIRKFRQLRPEYASQVTQRFDCLEDTARDGASLIRLRLKEEYA